MEGIFIKKIPCDSHVRYFTKNFGESSGLFFVIFILQGIWWETDDEFQGSLVGFSQTYFYNFQW